MTIFRKTIKKRKSPSTSATEYPEGRIEFGNDKNKWVVKETDKGVKRWVPFHSASLFGYAPLTANVLEKNINKPIVVYERQSQSFWPKSKKDFDVKYSFTASGDAELQTKDKNTLYSNWLKARKPAVKPDSVFIIKGVMKSNDLNTDIQVAPLPSELVSTKLMNTDAFIKI
jgi:hypothetical protein